MGTGIETVVLYHRGCADGIASAWAMYQKLGVNATYLPHQYGDTIPDEVDGCHVILVDLSFTEAQINELLTEERVRSIMIIDHHASAIKDLSWKLPPVKGWDDYVKQRDSGERQAFIYATVERSGAALTWMFIENYEATEKVIIPKVLWHMEDYDLWNHESADSRAITTWLMNGPLTIDRFNQIELPSGQINPVVLEVGRAMIEQDKRLVKSIIKNYVNEVKWGDGVVAFINGPHHLRNELADRIIDKYLFVVVYNVRDGKVIYSLRSKDFDVTTISKKFGGGGHPNAGAFAIDIDSDYLYPHHFIFEKPGLVQRAKMAWKVLCGWPR